MGALKDHVGTGVEWTAWREAQSEAKGGGGGDVSALVQLALPPLLARLRNGDAP